MSETPQPEPEPGSGRGPGPKRVLARKRRANVAGGRHHRHVVRVTPEEEARLLAEAEAQGVTVARLLIESALAPTGETVSQRHAALREVFAMQRTLGGIAVNINQLARLGNEQGRVPLGTDEALGEVRVAVTRLNGVLEEFSGS